MAARRAPTLTLLVAALWGPAMTADDPSVAVVKLKAMGDDWVIDGGSYRAGGRIESLRDYQAVAGHAPGAGDQPTLNPAPTDSGAGSAAILAACWTPEQLKGHPGERKIKLRLPADHSPPARLAPHHPYPPLGDAFARSLRSVAPFNDRKLIALTQRPRQAHRRGHEDPDPGHPQARLRPRHRQRVDRRRHPAPGRGML